MTKAQEMKYRILKAMDKTVREHTADECYIESWLMVGIPDGSTDLDFEEWATDKDEEDYLEFIETFQRLIDRMDKDPHELTRNEMMEKFISYI